MKNSSIGAIVCTLVALVAWGCSSPTSEDANAGGGGGGNTPQDFPDIPAPACANCNIPDFSDTLTTIEPLSGDGQSEFSPEVTRLIGDFQLTTVDMCYDAGCTNVCKAIPASRLYSAIWSDDRTQSFSLPGFDVETWLDFGFSGCNLLGTEALPGEVLTPRFGAVVDRLLLVEDGSFISDPGIRASISESYPIATILLTTTATLNASVDVTARSLTNPVYLRRDRFWVRQDVAEPGGSTKPSIELGGGSGTTLSIATTFIEGTSNTEAEEFSASLGFGGPGPLSFISGEISQKFKTSTTVATGQSVTKTFQVTGKDGKVIIATVWTITEVYSFTDAAGNPYTDPSYEFDLPALVIEGTKERLQTFEF